MKTVVQRVTNASVKVDNITCGQIDLGYLLLVGFSGDDTKEVCTNMANKIINLRIFEDENDKMNLDIKSVNGKILVVSQFTLYAKLNGRRPSFSGAMKYDSANELYEYFIEELRKNDIKVETGKFGADMKVSLLNDGPVTIIIDSKEDL